MEDLECKKKNFKIYDELQKMFESERGRQSSAIFTGAEIGPRCENRSRIMARDWLCKEKGKAECSWYVGIFIMIVLKISSPLRLFKRA